MNKSKAEEIRETRGIKPGDDIIVTKWIALEATARMASEGEKELQKRFPQAMINTAKGFAQYLNVAEEVATAEESGTGVAYELGEGGIFAALWNYADASGVGLDIDIRKIPIKQETVEICEFYGENPYEIDSAGSLLIATEDGIAMQMKLNQMQIPAVIIGKAHAGNDRILRNMEHIRYLDNPRL